MALGPRRPSRQTPRAVTDLCLPRCSALLCFFQLLHQMPGAHLAKSRLPLCVGQQPRSLSKSLESSMHPHSLAHSGTASDRNALAPACTSLILPRSQRYDVVLCLEGVCEEGKRKGRSSMETGSPKSAAIDSSASCMAMPAATDMASLCGSQQVRKSRCCKCCNLCNLKAKLKDLDPQRIPGHTRPT